MKRFLYLVSLLGMTFFLGLGTGCEPDRQPEAIRTREATQKQSEVVSSGKHWFFVKLKHFAGNYVLAINGFPIEEERVNIQAMNQEIGARANTALIGEGNTASVQVDPYLLRSKEKLSIGPMALKGWISVKEADGSYRKLMGNRLRPARITSAQVDSAYAAWRERARAKWKSYLAGEKRYVENHPHSARRFTSRRGGALDSLRAWAEGHPLTVTTTFDNEVGPDYSAIFEEAPVIEGTPADSARLRRYALKLRDLMKAEDARGLAEAYYDDSEQRSATPSDSLRLQAEIARFKNDWFKYDFILDFDGADVVLRKWCRGRVWQMYPRRAPGEGFFRTGIAFSMGGELYVAEIDGELRVVR